MGLAVRHEFLFDDFSITIGKDSRPAIITELFVGPFNHSMLFSGLASFHFARRGQFKALFGARLGLHFWHFGLLIWPACAGSLFEPSGMPIACKVAVPFWG